MGMFDPVKIVTAQKSVWWAEWHAKFFMEHIMADAGVTIEEVENRGIGEVMEDLSYGRHSQLHMRYFSDAWSAYRIVPKSYLLEVKAGNEKPCVREDWEGEHRLDLTTDRIMFHRSQFGASWLRETHVEGELPGTSFEIVLP